MSAEEISREPASPERLVMFTDAVVAIALTLLILPLMDAVGEIAGDGGTAADWFVAEGDALTAFALSFLLIAVFWIHHHRLFRDVTGIDGVLLWLNVAWMFTIVCMPVATALTAQLPDDRIQTSAYVGTLLAVSLTHLAARVHLARHPDLHRLPPGDTRAGLVGAAIASGLFALAGAIAVAVPVIGYFSLLLLLLSGPLASLAAARIRQ